MSIPTLKNIFALCIASVVVAGAYAQEEVTYPKLTLFRSGKPDPKAGFIVSEPATSFEFQGAKRNLFFKVEFEAPADAKRVYWLYITDSKGIFADEWKGIVKPGETSANWGLTLNPGQYTVALMDLKVKDKVLTSTKIQVVNKLGATAVAGQKAGSAKFWICKETDDNWNPVGADGDPEKGIFHWPANKKFNVLIKNNGKVFGTSFLGIIIHKQGPDGKDVSFVNEFQSESLDEKAGKWATVDGIEGLDGLPAGTYSIYVISWDKRETLEHRGNLTQYFSKVTLITK